MAPRIEICDVTPRDGDQMDGVNLSTLDKVWFARKDDALGLTHVEGGFPASSSVDREVFTRLREDPLQHATLIAFGMTRRKDTTPDRDRGLQTLLRSGAPAIALVGKSSRFHVKRILGIPPRQNLAMIRGSFQYLRERSDAELLFDAEHFFDGFRDDPDFALRTLETAWNAGATRLVLCDTNGGSDPEQVRKAVRTVRREFRDAILGIHPHNDRGLAIANMLAAVRAGVRHVQGTWNGLGERTGNLDLVSAIMNLRELGYETIPEDLLPFLTPLSEEAALHARCPRNPAQPYTGEKAFAHKGGMHVAAVAKDPRSYEHIDPALVGNERRILGSKQAGIANIRSLIQDAKLLSGDVKMAALRSRPLLEEVLKSMKEMEAEGYAFDHANASLELLLLEVLDPSFKPILQVEEADVHMKLGVRKRRKMRRKHKSEPTRAIVKARINGESQTFLKVAQDEGPIGALSMALLEAMVEKFREMAPQLKLVDYRMIKVPSSEEGEHSPVYVTVEFRDGEELFRTTGVSRNSVEAGWQCVVDAFEYKLQRDSILAHSKAKLHGSAA